MFAPSFAMTKTLKRASGCVSADLYDARIGRARGAIGAQQQIELGCDIRVAFRREDGIEVLLSFLPETGDRFLRGAAGDERGGTRGAEQAIGREIVRVGVAGALAGDNAHAAACAHSLAGGFYQRFVEADGRGGDGLEVEVGIVTAGRKRLAQAALKQPLGDAEGVEKIAPVLGARRNVLCSRRDVCRVMAHVC
jgi:hypothetical protein